MIRVIPGGQAGNRPRSPAGRLASDCQWCEKAPCAGSCPVHIDMPGILRRLEADNLLGAGKRLRETDPGSPAASTCASCSPGSAPPCEKACVRGSGPAGSLRIREILTELSGGSDRDSPSLAGAK